MAIATTGTVSTVEMISRWRSGRLRSSSSTAPVPPALAEASAVRDGGGGWTVYPAFSTAATSSSRATSSPW